MDEEVKRGALQRLKEMGYADIDKQKVEQSLGMADYGGATRAALQNLLADKSPVEGFTQQLQNPEQEAPSGFDVAESFGSKYGVDNPYALGALATLADVVDPTMVMPMGSIGKAPQALKTIRGLSSVGELSFPARNVGEALAIEKSLKASQRVPEGSLLNLGEKSIQRPMPSGPITGIPEIKTANTARQMLSPEEIAAISEQFPQAQFDKTLLRKKYPR